MKFLKIFVLCLFFLLNSSYWVFAQEQSETSKVDEVSSEEQDGEGFGDFEEFEEDFSQEEKKEVYDPLIKYNRFMFTVNDKLYFYMLKPVAETYSKAVPEKIRIAIRKFFKNISFPVRFVNNLIQGKFKNSAVEFERFIINTTVGCLGFFDPATSQFGLTSKNEDFGQTLGVYGTPAGVPIVLPVFGFSNVRDAVGVVADYFLNPTSYISQYKPRVGVSVTDKINAVSLQIGVYESLKKDAIDPYTYFRDFYSKDRVNKIKE